MFVIFSFQWNQIILHHMSSFIFLHPWVRECPGIIQRVLFVEFGQYIICSTHDASTKENVPVCMCVCVCGCVCVCVCVCLWAHTWSIEYQESHVFIMTWIHSQVIQGILEFLNSWILEFLNFWMAPSSHPSRTLRLGINTQYADSNDVKVDS